jgi:hypothetical protein
MPGAILVTLGFVVSTVLIFIGGNVAFGLFSVLPAGLAGMIIYQTLKITHNKSVNTKASDAGSGQLKRNI